MDNSYLGSFLVDEITLEIDMCPFGVEHFTCVDLIIRYRLLARV
jgi:hypothetical protein